MNVDMLDRLSIRDLEAEVSARAAELKQIDQLAKAAMDRRDGSGTLDLQDERAKAVQRLTFTRGQLALRAARIGRLP